MKYSFVKNELKGDNRITELESKFAYGETGTVRRLHEMVEGYRKTELKSFPGLAKETGVGAIFLKDESTRFGLKAFKGLGGVYAMFRMICMELGLDPHVTMLAKLLEEPIKSQIADMTFITTTDGNHGKGVSWAAKVFGAKAYVFMPKGTVEVRAEAVRNAGNAICEITDMKYDDCVAYTARLAEEKGWKLIQDTSWDGYENVPLWIMQGYTTMVFEALEQMGEIRPTHVFLQAGVGAMAGAVMAALKTAQRENPPMFITVEPETVACVYESIEAKDGLPHAATGSGETCMAGLNCGTPCTLAWEVLKNNTSYAFSCDDDIAENGIFRLAYPMFSAEGAADPSVISGESGAAPFGLLFEILMNAKCGKCDALNALGLDENSVVLLISTEGDTDPENWRRVTRRR